VHFFDRLGLPATSPTFSQVGIMRRPTPRTVAGALLPSQRFRGHPREGVAAFNRAYRMGPNVRIWVCLCAGVAKIETSDPDYLLAVPRVQNTSSVWSRAQVHFPLAVEESGTAETI
jgi:hypothetical protein